MDIALITQLINSHSSSRVPLELAKNFALNNKVTIYSYPDRNDKNLIANLKKLNIKVILLPNLSDSLSNQIKNTVSLAIMLNKANHDIISSHCLLPLFSATWFCQKPTVSTYYGTQQNTVTEKTFPKKMVAKDILMEKVLNMIIFFMQWLIVNTTSKTVTISNYARGEAKKKYHRKLKVIPLGSISNSLKNG